MNRALWGKAIRDGRLLLAALATVMFAVPWLLIWTTSMIDLSAFSDFLLNAVPAQWERISGVSFREVATPAGRIALAYVHPLVELSATVWAIARGSYIVAGEVEQGTMEMLLAQTVRRVGVYCSQAVVIVAGAAVLATATWCGTVAGLTAVNVTPPVPASIYISPAVNLFSLTVCIGGVSALFSSWESSRWRAIGIAGAWFAICSILKFGGRLSDHWRWIAYLSPFSAYEPQAFVARPADAWSLLAYQDGAIVGLGLAGQHVVLIALGLLSFALGAWIFSRRDLPAPL